MPALWKLSERHPDEDGGDFGIGWWLSVLVSGAICWSLKPISSVADTSISSSSTVVHPWYA